MTHAELREAVARSIGRPLGTADLEWSMFAHCWVKVDRKGNVVAAWDEELRPIDIQPLEAPHE